MIAVRIDDQKESSGLSLGRSAGQILTISERRRQDWYRAYIKSIVERDLPEISNLAKPDQIPRVLQVAA